MTPRPTLPEDITSTTVKRPPVSEQLQPSAVPHRDRTALDRWPRTLRGTPNELLPPASQLRRDQHILSYQQLTGPFWRNRSSPARRPGRIVARRSRFGRALTSRSWRIAVAGLLAFALAIMIGYSL